MSEFCFCTIPKDKNLDYFDKCYNSRSNEYVSLMFIKVQSGSFHFCTIPKDENSGF